MSNNQLYAWRYEEHFHRIPMSEDYDGHYEVTNGNISLCTTDDPEDITETENTLQRVANALNESGCKFYCNTATEHALHIENMQLRMVLADIADGACDYENINHELIHSTECKACKAKQWLESLKPNHTIRQNLIGI